MNINMNFAKYKPLVDIVSMIMLLVAIVTGFMLHKEVWHLHLFNDHSLWSIHEAVGLVLLVFVAGHCLQHSFWFKNYAKIKPDRKRVTTILLIIGIIVAISGIILMCGSRSELISHIHYVCAILFTIISIGHIAKRWKILKNLL